MSTFEIIITAGSLYFLYVIFKPKNKKVSKKSSSNDQLELSFNLDIYDEDTKKQAQKDIRKLESYIELASAGSIDVIYDAIDQLQDAIESYEKNIEDTLYAKMMSDPIQLDSYNLKLHYKDAKGDVTNRDVDVKEFDGVYLSGYCHLRSQQRTFRIDRVKEVFDGYTGEKIEVDDLAFHLRAAYENSPLYALDEVFDKYYNLLKVIMFTVKADGRFTAKEKEVVKDIIISLVDDKHELDVGHINKLMSWVEVPSIQAFKIAVGKIFKEENNFDLIKIAEDITATKKKLHPQEEFVLEYIKKRSVQ